MRLFEKIFTLLRDFFGHQTADDVGPPSGHESYGCTVEQRESCTPTRVKLSQGAIGAITKH